MASRRSFSPRMAALCFPDVIKYGTMHSNRWDPSSYRGRVLLLRAWNQ